MTGNELVRAARAAKGKIQVPVLFGEDVVYLYVEKADLIRHCAKIGDDESRMKIEMEHDGFTLDRI